jgi:hypothetical protein
MTLGGAGEPRPSEAGRSLGEWGAEALSEVEGERVCRTARKGRLEMRVKDRIREMRM